MTDVYALIEEQYTNSARLQQLSYGTPEGAAARASTEPQQMYADRLARCPIEHHGDSLYTAYTMADLLFLNKHRNVEQGSRFLGSTRPAIPLGLDGEQHRKYRRLLDPVFAPKRIAPLEAKIRQLANEIIDQFVDNGEVDAYHAWCEPLPSTIFLSVMGLPMSDRDNFISFKNRILGTADPSLSADEVMAQRMEAVAWIQSYFMQDLDLREREAVPRDDMIGWLLTTEVDGDRLTREDVLDILGLLMIAGLDTVAASLACFLSYFARHADQRARIVDDRALLPSAIEELMRFESPVTEGMRRVLVDITLPSGTVLPAGSWVMISWSAANLDPDAFPNPLDVDLERSPNAHIGFASGFHRCLGSHLARMEMRAALDVWHDRIPNYQIAPDVELSYSGNPRAPHQLPLVWPPRI